MLTPSKLLVPKTKVCQDTEGCLKVFESIVDATDLNVAWKKVNDRL